MTKKVELLSPAGNLEKLQTAFLYGADAVYAGSTQFSLRAKADNFTDSQLARGIEYAHNLGKKVYVAVNILPRNSDLVAISNIVTMIDELGADAIIIADPGLLSLIKRKTPNLEVHISTQANITNIETARMYVELGAKRLILARELSLEEIGEIITLLPKDISVETFVHGAMCMAYSGRCLLSNYMANRESNRGDCAQPCRWNYHLVEEKRPGEYMPVYEDERGTYIFNSKDLCLIDHMKELIEVGIASLKIEGRMKSVFYNACTTRAYRGAIDEYYNDPSITQPNSKWFDEASAASHRQFTTGFYFKSDPEAQIYTTSSYLREKIFVAKVISYDKKTKQVILMQRNKIVIGDELEFMLPNGNDFTHIIKNMTNLQDQPIESTPHAEMMYKITVNNPVTSGTLVRKDKEETL